MLIPVLPFRCTAVQEEVVHVCSARKQGVATQPAMAPTGARTSKITKHSFHNSEPLARTEWFCQGHLLKGADGVLPPNTSVSSGAERIS